MNDGQSIAIVDLSILQKEGKTEFGNYRKQLMWQTHNIPKVINNFDSVKHQIIESYLILTNNN